MNGNEWPRERIELLRTYIGHGRSSGYIARALGVSRNAVVGKARRLGLRLGKVSGSELATYRPPAAARPKPRKTPPKATPGPVLVPAPPPRAREIFRPEQPIELVDLKLGVCRYPLGDVAPFLFCGTTTRDDACVYCAEHAALCYSPPPRRSLPEQARAFG